MRAAAYAFLLLFLFSGIDRAFAQENGRPPLGTWEGESICTVPNSPCHDEHVVYEITPAKKSAGDIEIAAYKIVNGEKLFMGSLPCTYSAAKSELRCHFRADDLWLFTISGDRMKGTLTIKGDTLFRRVNVQRKSPPPS